MLAALFDLLGAGVAIGVVQVLAALSVLLAALIGSQRWDPRLDPGTGSRRDWIRKRQGELISCDSSRDDVGIYYEIGSFYSVRIRSSCFVFEPDYNGPSV